MKTLPYCVLPIMFDIISTSVKNEERIKEYENLYWKTKRDKLIKRSRRSRLCKRYEKEWIFWHSINDHFNF